MTIITLVHQARQLLEILSELEQGKAYDIDQLGEHIGVRDKKELYEVSQILKDQGCVEIIRGHDDSGGPIVAMALRSLDFDPGLVTLRNGGKSGEKSGGITSASVELVSTQVPKPTGQEPRVDIRLQTPPPPETAPQKEPAVRLATNEQKIGSLTIEQILLQLAEAIEQSDALDAPTKYPLLEKIQAVAGHPAISSWLKTPLKNIV